MLEEYRRDPAARLYPPPTRIGMIRLVALATELTGDRSEGAGALFSCLASIASLFVAAAIGIRFFPPAAALFGLLFYAVSAMELALARRTWTDAVTEFLAISLIYAAAEITRNSRRVFWYPLFAALGSIALPTKESTLVAYGGCALWAMWVLLKERRAWRNAAILAACVLAGAAVTILWMAASGVAISDLRAEASGVSAANAANEYAIQYASGPGYLLLESFWVINPTAALLCLAGIWTALAGFRRPSAERQPFWSALFTLAYLALPMVLPHRLNLRYLAAIFGPFYLLAGLGLWRIAGIGANLLEAADRRAFTAVMAGAVLLAAIFDYARFERIFVRAATPDLSVKMMLDSR
jgi:hypothetical protein